MDDNIVTQSSFENLGRRLWKLSCIAATMVTTIWQLNEYCNEPDRTIVEYKAFDGTYPSVTVCLTNTLIEEKLKAYGDGVNSLAYISFLAGAIWDERFLRINYDDVTQDLGEYILEYGYVSRKRETHVMYVAGQNKDNKPNLKTGFRMINFMAGKCFAINHPFIKGQKIVSFYVKLRQDIFKEGKRLDVPGRGDNPLENQFAVTMHYPNQYLWSIDYTRSRWHLRESNAPKNYVMAFNVLSIDAVHTRNSHNSPCLEGSMAHDTEQLQLTLRSLGCKPPYWNSSSTVPQCTEQDQFILAANRTISLLLGHDESKLKPCRRFENIVYSYEDVIAQLYGSGNSSVSLWFNIKTPHYKELKGVKNMELQTFVGK